MGPLKQLEETLKPVFTDKAPFQLPENAKKWIVEYGPIIGAVLGVLGIIASLSLWSAAHAVNNLVDYSNAISKAYGTGETVKSLGIFFYLSFILLIITSVISIVAYPGLKARSKTRGWDLLFLSAIVSLLYGVLDAAYSFDVMSLVSRLIGSALGLYILFQIRSYYMGTKKTSSEKSAEPAKTTKK
jgi:uncharacterized BrkB/YihY/UPF0761 family membrane protein